MNGWRQRSYMEAKVQDAINAFNAIVGPEYVLQDEEKRRFFSQDLSVNMLELAAVVVQPGSAEEVAAVVKEATSRGLSVIPRGGGMSYTQGYLPVNAHSVLVDTRRLNKIIEVNVDDMYVTAECGVTWEQLTEALEPHGVRTPFWGTLSGQHATLGGGLGNNATLLGASRYGTMAESVINIEVVLANGDIISTGSAARNAAPYFRYFGPDLTGLFIGDAGAFGIKTKVTMKLIKAPAVLVAASFGFRELRDMIAAQTEMGRLKIASELYSCDPDYHASFVNMGFTYLADYPWSLHFTVDETDEETAQLLLDKLRAVAQKYGDELENTLPLATRAVPFARLRSSGGRLVLPIHTLVPYSRAYDAYRLIQSFMAEHDSVLKQHNISMSIRTSAGTNAMLLEPMFYWNDQYTPLHLQGMDTDEVERLSSLEPGLAARQAVTELRRELATRFYEFGGVSMQLGKYYDWKSYLNEENWALLKAMKGVFDPDGLMNPGALGLS